MSARSVPAHESPWAHALIVGLTTGRIWNSPDPLWVKFVALFIFGVLIMTVWHFSRRSS